jgi:hypothetical protein
MVSPSRGVSAAPPKPLLVLLRVALLLVPLLVFAAPRQAHAYTWMIKHGYSTCGACHTDPSGGELLTFYGRVLSGEALSTHWTDTAQSAQRDARPPRLAFDPTRFAAHAKLADKEGNAAANEADNDNDDDTEAKTDDTAAESKEGATEAASADAAPAPAAAEPTDLTPFMFGLFSLPDWLQLGASYRHMNIITPAAESKFRTFPMMMDVYGQAQFGGFKLGGSIGGARVAAGSPYARAAQVTANQGKEWNLISRTHYIGYEITSELQVRGGRLNLPFGVRIPEHTMWVRQATRTDRESAQQHGVSVNYTIDQLRFELMGIAGNYQVHPDKFRERGYSGYFEYFPNPKTGLGVTSLVTVSKTDPITKSEAKSTRQVHGAMARAGLSDRVALVAEFDGLFTSRRETGYVGFTQLDVEPLGGFHVFVTGEILDQGFPKPLVGATTAVARTAGEGKPKVGGWLSLAWFIYAHFDVRLDAIKRTGEDVSLLAQLHVYL